MNLDKDTLQNVRPGGYRDIEWVGLTSVVAQLLSSLMDEKDVVDQLDWQAFTDTTAQLALDYRFGKLNKTNLPNP